jgi:hypothetical membrane protein
MRSRSPIRLLLLTGLVGPLLFAITVVFVGSLRPGYSHVNQFMSELGETGGYYAWVMNYLGFMISAGLILIFVIAFRTRLPRTVLNSVGTSLLIVFAVSMFFAGVYSCDVGCPLTERSLDQKLHDLFSILAFPAFTAGVFICGLSLSRTASWRRFGIYSLVTASLSLILLVAMIQSEALREGTGIYQRLYLGVLFLWLAAMSVKQFREFGNDKTGQEAT